MRKPGRLPCLPMSFSTTGLKLMSNLINQSLLMWVLRKGINILKCQKTINPLYTLNEEASVKTKLLRVLMLYKTSVMEKSWRKTRHLKLLWVLVVFHALVFFTCTLASIYGDCVKRLQLAFANVFNFPFLPNWHVENYKMLN